MTDASIDLQQPPSDVEFDCIGEVKAPSNVEEDHIHATYGGTNLVGSKFRFISEDGTTSEVTWRVRFENFIRRNYADSASRTTPEACRSWDEYHWTMSLQRPHSKSREGESRSRF